MFEDLSRNRKLVIRSRVGCLYKVYFSSKVLWVCFTKTISYFTPPLLFRQPCLYTGTNDVSTVRTNRECSSKVDRYFFLIKYFVHLFYKNDWCCFQLTHILNYVCQSFETKNHLIAVSTSLKHVSVKKTIKGVLYKSTLMQYNLNTLSWKVKTHHILPVNQLLMFR